MRTVDRILAVADIHGDNERFQELLSRAEYHPDHDGLVICGDMIDRGTENLDTVASCMRLRNRGAVLLKGNHEQFAEEVLMEMLASDSWRTKPSENLTNWIQSNGGANMYNEIKDLSAAKLAEILDFIRSLPLYLTIGKHVFSHAGANTRKAIQENTEDELVWMEEAFPYCPAYLGKVMVFGHVPTWQLYSYNKINRKEAKIWFDQQHKDKIGIDCGCGIGGRLAALELPSYREFYV